MPAKRKGAAPTRRSKRLKGEPAEDKPEAPPSLLTIAPELRNQIYDLVLIEPNGSIDVTADLKEPALLSVCRQVRNEARGIWFSQNKFLFDIIDCDVTLMARWVREKQGIGREMTGMLFAGRPNWTNLVAWCRALFLEPWYVCAVGKFPAAADPFLQDLVSVLRTATSMAQELRSQEAEWKSVEKFLGLLRETAGRVDSRWLED